jgi:hypothetical protein
MPDGPHSSPVRFPPVMSGSPGPSQEGGRIIPVLLLFALGAAVTGATVFAGGPIAQSHGDLRTQILYCLTAIGLPGFAYWAVTKRLCSPGSPVYLLAFLLPAYALWQTLPLPLALIRLLSPSRAALTEALRPVIPVPAWVPISVVPSATQSRTTVSPERGLFSVDYRNLWRRASGGARSSGVYDNRHGADDRYQRVFVCQSAKGFFPAAEFSPAFCYAATPFAGATASENLYLRQMKRLPRYAWR